MVAISQKSYNVRRRGKLLELTLIEALDENSDSESCLSSKSIESGFYEDLVNEESENVNTNEASDTSAVSVSDVHQYDSLLLSQLIDSETDEDEEAESRKPFLFKDRNINVNDESINHIVCDVHQYDSLLENPVEDLDSSSEEDENYVCELDTLGMGGQIMELLSNSIPAVRDEDEGEEESSVSNSALQESNFMFKDREHLDDVAINERVGRAILSSDSAMTIEIGETGDSFALTSPDRRPQTFLHKVDRVTFNKRLDTLAEVNKLRLSGWQGNVAYVRSKRGGLRDCFSKEMTQFEEVHKKSVKKLFQSQIEEVEHKSADIPSLPVRNPLRPKLTHYQDFIQLRPSMFDPAVVDQLLLTTLSPVCSQRREIIQSIDEENDSLDDIDTPRERESNKEYLHGGSDIENRMTTRSSFEDNLSMPLFD